MSNNEKRRIIKNIKKRKQEKFFCKTSRSRERQNVTTKNGDRRKNGTEKKRNLSKHDRGKEGETAT